MGNGTREAPENRAAGVKPEAKNWLAVGGVLAAVGASSCCVIPFVLFTLGVSGAWMGNLTALAPYQPIFLVLALALLAAGFWRVYRRPRPDISCADGEWCARPSSSRFAKLGLWVAAGLVALALAFPYVTPLFLNA